MPYVYRITIKGKFKDFEKMEELVKYLLENLKHPCCTCFKITSFHPTENMISKMGFQIRR